VKMTKERLWCLKQFGPYGWSIGRGGWIGVKKWDAHKAALVKGGYLEQDGELYRATDAGRWLMESDKP
jgi:hypothetical protein